MLQFRHDVGPVPTWDLGITNFVDQVTEIRKAKNQATAGPVQQAHILAAAAQSNCTLNLFNGYPACIKIPCEFLIGPRNGGLNTA